MTSREALERYGTDKPDLRFGMEFQDLTDLLQAADCRLFQQTRGTGERIRGIRAPGGGVLSLRELDELAAVARAAGAAGSIWLRRTDEGLAGAFARGLDEGLTWQFIERTGLRLGDRFVAMIGHYRTAPLVAESHFGATDAPWL